ncbi:MAG: hypothetical protein ACXV3A_08735, partial [Kineosporiaceae bacterium]
YAAGRFWIEALRIDPANHILGLRLNLWTSLLVGLGALAYIIVSARLRPGREESVYRDHRDVAEPEEDAATSPATTRWMAWVRSRPNRRAADADDESCEPSETPPDEPETGATAAAGDDSSEDGNTDGNKDGNEDGTQDRGEDTLRSETSGDPRPRAEAAKASSSGDVGPADTLT